MDLQNLNNTVKDRFAFVEMLGKGGAGAVCLVKDKSKRDQLVALKVLVNENAFDEKTLERFYREIQISKSLKHPNLIEAFELIDLGNSIGYTMEYIEGRDLSQVIGSHELTYDKIESIFCQILDGLAMLHKNNIVHRDLKLENVIIRDDGVVKLTDFGLIKPINQKNITKTGILLGTAQYLPPEYIKKGIYDHRGDLFAVGIMLFEIITKKRRLQNLPGNKAIEHLIQTNFTLPYVSLSGIQRKYVEIVLKATEINPNKRYQSAEEMKYELLNWSPNDIIKQNITAPTIESKLDLNKLNQIKGGRHLQRGSIAEIIYIYLEHPKYLLPIFIAIISLCILIFILLP